MPGVSRACARNMVPNLPQPISPTRTGRPASARSESRRWRFMLASKAGTPPAACAATAAAASSHNCWYNKKKEAKGLPSRMML